MFQYADKHPFMKDLIQLFPGLPYLGLGVWLAWLFLVHSGTFWLSDTAIDGSNISSMYLLSTGISAAFMLLMPFLSRIVQSLLVRPVWIYCGAALVSMGALSIILAGPYYLHIKWLFFVGVVMTGIGAVPIIFKCAQLYSNLTPGKTVVYIVLSQLLVVTLYYFFMGAAWYTPVAGGPSLSGIIGLVALPIVSAFLITITMSDSKTIDSNDYQDNESQLKPRSAFFENGLKNMLLISGFWKLCIVVLFFTIVTSVVQGMTIHSSSPNENMIHNNLEILLLILCAIAFLYFMLRIVKKRNFGKFYLMLMVGIAVALTLASSLQVYGGVFRVFVSLALHTFDMLLWCLLAFIVQRRGVSFIVVFGFGRGIFMAGGVFGWILGAWVMPMLPPAWPSSVLFMILATLVLVCAIVIFSEKDFELLFSSVFESFDENMTETQRGGLDPFEKKEGEQPRKRLYLEACEHVGKEARLSKREQEVFNLLAQSRGNDNIAKRLNISSSTVRTHTNNIYSKLNVHSRHELIEIIEIAWRNETTFL